MEEARFRKLYKFLVKNEELKELMPSATGDWDKDKDRFIKIQLKMENMANLKNVDL